MSPARAVLDTNVCLDLFVFGDRRCAALLEAVRTRTLDAVTDAACRAEWLRVLTYPQLALDGAARDRAVAAFDACVRLLDAPFGAIVLPRCADPDDQKFLRLAADTSARWLLSRDDALLRLGRRTARVAGFEVLTPERWSQAWNGAAATA